MLRISDNVVSSAHRGVVLVVLGAYPVDGKRVVRARGTYDRLVLPEESLRHIDDVECWACVAATGWGEHGCDVEGKCNNCGTDAITPRMIDCDRCGEEQVEIISEWYDHDIREYFTKLSCGHTLGSHDYGDPSPFNL